MRVLDFSGCRALVLGAFLVAGGYGEAFEYPARVPAEMSEKMLMSPLTAVTAAGQRLVAVGQRGHIAVSDDGGQSWKQAAAPASVDLVAVSFVNERHGWAVGHGGVVLHSEDGGLNWILQLDGQQASRLILDYYSDPARGGALVDAQNLVERENTLVSYGGTQALMGVHFIDAQNGFVVGLFNRILRTADGGKTWEPWQHRIDNPNELHFYSLAADGEAIYVTGEQGMVWRMAKDGEQFSAIPTDYAGTLFGACSNSKELIVFGMRGSVFRSEDAGAAWQKAELGISAGITAGTFLANGQLVLGSLSGDLVLSRDGGRSFSAVTLKKSMPFFGLVAEPAGQLTLVGAFGVLREAVVLEPTPAGNASRLVEGSADRQTNLLGAGYGSGH